MNKTGPLMVLGAISAMETFVENFPMSILDLMHGPTYTSVFVFLIDILRECNIPIQKIADRVIERVFGIEAGIQGGVNTIYQQIMNLEIDEQSEFLKSLEDGVKTILMSLLASIFSCSAVPILPLNYFDTGRIHYIGYDDIDDNFEEYREYLKNTILDDEIVIPISTLNSFGHLDVNPFSNAGKLFFSVDGGDKYFRKVVKTDVVDENETVTEPDCDVLSKVFICFGEGHAEFLSNKSAIDEIVLRTDTPIDEDIVATIYYTNQNGESTISDIVIPAGQRTSEVFFLTANDDAGRKDLVQSIKIGGGTGKSIVRDGKKIYVYLSKNESMDVVNFWKANGNDTLDTMPWGSANGCGTRTYTIIEAEEQDKTVYEYIPSSPEQDAVRMSYVPSNPNEGSPEYIVSYQGLDPNTLYRTDDMNAFIWYVANRSVDEPQIELNKTMWDNRREAKKYGAVRETGADWNSWYNSKGNADREFVFNNGYYGDEIKPIVQLRKSDNAITVKFPSQTYFKPKATPFDNKSTYRYLRENSTIYRFNYDYLQSIKIFNPKVLIFSMFDALLNGALSLRLDINLSLTRTELEKMISNAIKSYIEADDAEIEDCFFTFSNEQYDTMLKEMLLSKYGATQTGGEVNRATQHDLDRYINEIDSINLSSSAAGETTKITKLLTEVSVTAGDEGSIDYGISGGIDEGWWKNLLWAIALPLIKSIFTPQVIMLFLINFQIMGITTLEDLWGNNQAKIIRLIVNKIFSLVKSIFLYVRDKLAEILLDYFVEVILPVLAEYQLLKLREKLEAWIMLLSSAIACLPRLKFNKQKERTTLDEVDYADIINDQKTPETTGGC